MHVTDGSDIRLVDVDAGGVILWSACLHNDDHNRIARTSVADARPNGPAKGNTRST